MSKPKPWSMGKGAFVGFFIGALVWWSAYEPSAGLLQKPQLIIFPMGVGIGAVALRNRRRKVGAWDPETIARNRRGRL